MHFSCKGVPQIIDSHNIMGYQASFLDIIKPFDAMNEPCKAKRYTWSVILQPSSDHRGRNSHAKGHV